MTPFTITGTPIQVVSAPTGASLSLLNQGPSTITLKSDSSVTAGNGMLLPPMGQISWAAREPLWAVCASGSTATLVVNDSAGPLDANRSRFWSLLGSVVGPVVPSAFPSTTIECGHCETILIKISLNGGQSSSSTFPTSLRLDCAWLDDLGNIIELDYMDVANLVVNTAQNPSTIVIRLPVVGTKFNVFQLVQNLGAIAASILRVDFYGSDRSFPYRWYCIDVNNSIVLSWTQSDSVSSINGDSFTYQAIPSAHYTNPIYLATLGKWLSLTLNATGITTAGRKEVRLALDNTVSNISSFTVNASGQIVHTETIIPTKTLLIIGNGAGLAGGSMDVLATWKDI